LKKKKILISGGTGFIGYHLAVAALKNNWKVTSISTKPPSNVRFLKGVKYIYCDISKENEIKKKISPNYDYVVNLGGYVDHSKKKKTYQSHYIGCKNLSKFFLNRNIKCFIQMGSSVEYGFNKSPQFEKVKIKEDSLKSTYAKSKLLSSNFLIKLFRENSFPVIIFRLYLAYGPKQDINRFIPIIINSSLKDHKFACSDGKQLRDFIYINDVISAIIKALKKKNAVGQIFNLGSGKPKKLRKIIKEISSIINKGVPDYGKVKLRKDEMSKIYPNISKTKKILNWKPKTSFKIGLKRTIQYYKKKFNNHV